MNKQIDAGRVPINRHAETLLAGVSIIILLGACGAGAQDPPTPPGTADTAAVIDTIIQPPVATDTIGPTAPLSEYHLRRFRERGIEDPLRDIPADLRGRPDLIPDEPVLGGTMRFTRVTLLTDRWVLATYEDGHIQGHAILEYVVEEDAEIRWTVVSHYVD